jgi:hypothetical protein
LIGFLFLFVSVDILNQIGLLWALDDNLSHFLRGFDLIDFLFESLSDDL